MEKLVVEGRKSPVGTPFNQLANKNLRLLTLGVEVRRTKHLGQIKNMTT